MRVSSVRSFATAPSSASPSAAKTSRRATRAAGERGDRHAGEWVEASGLELRGNHAALALEHARELAARDASDSASRCVCRHAALEDQVHARMRQRLGALGRPARAGPTAPTSSAPRRARDPATDGNERADSAPARRRPSSVRPSAARFSGGSSACRVLSIPEQCALPMMFQHRQRSEHETLDGCPVHSARRCRFTPRSERGDRDQSRAEEPSTSRSSRRRLTMPPVVPSAGCSSTSSSTATSTGPAKGR